MAVDMTALYRALSEAGPSVVTTASLYPDSAANTRKWRKLLRARSPAENGRSSAVPATPLMTPVGSAGTTSQDDSKRFRSTHSDGFIVYRAALIAKRLLPALCSSTSELRMGSVSARSSPAPHSREPLACRASRGQTC